MITKNNVKYSFCRVTVVALMFSLCVFLMLGVPMAEAIGEKVVETESKTMDLLSRIDAFAEGDPDLAEDSAKAHYNMGNIYYQKGEYEIAAREYYQAAILMPNDPDVHYNLAYVSSEHLFDFETALKHYKLYLYLNPNAKDIKYVKEKIVEAELQVRSKVNSDLEKDKMPIGIFHK